MSLTLQLPSCSRRGFLFWRHCAYCVIRLTPISRRTWNRFVTGFPSTQHRSSPRETTDFGLLLTDYLPVTFTDPAKRTQVGRFPSSHLHGFSVWRVICIVSFLVGSFFFHLICMCFLLLTSSLHVFFLYDIIVCLFIWFFYLYMAFSCAIFFGLSNVHGVTPFTWLFFLIRHFSSVKLKWFFFVYVAFSCRAYGFHKPLSDHIAEGYLVL